MNHIEFLGLLLDNIYVYIICFLIVAFIYFLILKKLWKGILDPIFMSWIGSTFASSVMVFLWVTSAISAKYFMVFLLTQGFFFIGFYIGCKQRVRDKFFKLNLKDENLFSECLYLTLVVICVVTQLLQYAIVGIPLFMGSRLEAGLAGGGIGIMIRILGVSSFFSIFMSFYFFKKRNGFLKIVSRFYLLFSVASGILGGSKSALFMFGMYFFLFATMYREKFKDIYNVLANNTKSFILLGVFGILCFYGTKTSGELFVIGAELGMRLVGFGDMYWMAFPYAQVEHLDNSTPFYALFSSLLGSFRIVSYEELPQALGFQLVALVDGINSPTWGPNARLNLFSYLYYGIVGGAMFSLVCGYVGGRIRNLFFRSSNLPIIEGMILAWLYKSATTLETDPTMLIFHINSFLLIFPLIIFISIIFFFIVSFAKMQRSEYEK